MIDPAAPLLASGNDAVVYFAKRDLLGEDVGPVEDVWKTRYAEGDDPSGRLEEERGLWLSLRVARVLQRAGR